MEAMNHILFLFLILGITGCLSDKCDTGCAPTWILPEPSLCTVDRIEGEDVDFRCQAFGNPRPLVTWSKDGKPLQKSDDKITVGVDSVRMVDIYPENKGSYTCLVENQFGSLEWSFYLGVYERDSEEINGPKNKTGYINQTTHFWCQIAADDADATFTWLHDVYDVTNATSSVSTVVVKHGLYRGYDQLVLPRLRLSDAGLYSCLVNTTLTSVRRSAWLTVTYNPDSDFRTAGSRERGVSRPTSPFARYLQNVGIAVGAISGIALCVTLSISAVTLYRNWRKLKSENRGAKRLFEEPTAEQTL